MDYVFSFDSVLKSSKIALPRSRGAWSSGDSCGDVVDREAHARRLLRVNLKLTKQRTRSP
jgi:hypothetical protein